MIPLSSLVKWHAPTSDGSKPKLQTDRVLGFDAERKRIALINVVGKKAKIRFVAVALLGRMLSERTAVIATFRPAPNKNTEGIEKYRNAVHRSMLLFRESKEFLFNCHERADLVRRAAVENKLPETTIRNYLVRYLQAAGRKDEIGCDYKNCGTPKGNRILSKKQGTPGIFAGIETRFSGEPLSEADQKSLKLGIAAHVLGIENRHRSIESAWRLTLANFFREWATDESGKKTKLVFRSVVPSHEQFVHFLNEHHSEEQIKLSRMSTAGAGTSGRAKTGKSRALDPKGPGDVYQVDSTLADIYLVNSQEAQCVIGRPTLYLVVDVWSRMIVGFHVTLNHPSYEEACIALLSVLEDKVELCKRYGIDITADEWPNAPFCAELVSDRQEFLWAKSDILGERTGITLSNTPAYRGDFKGLVEYHMGRAMKVLWSMPGAVDTDASKDEPKSKDNAIYTLNDFIYLIILDILAANRRTKLTFPLPKAAADLAEPPLTPTEIFIWGRDHLSGIGLAMDREELAQKILPLATTASSCDEGIRVSAFGCIGIYYEDTSGKLPEELFHKGGERPLRVQVDSRTMYRTIVEHPHTRELVVCTLKMRLCPQFRTWSWAEGASYQLRIKLRNAKKQDKALDQWAEDYDRTEQLTAEAVAARLSAGPITRAGVKNSAKDARLDEKNRETAARTPRIPHPSPAANPFEPDEDDE